MAQTNMAQSIVGGSGSGLGQNEATGTVRTTDATQTTIIEIPVAQGQTIRVDAHITARKSDGSKHGSWHVAGLFYRNTGGNVTIEGMIQHVASFLSVTSSWTVDLTADTTTQCVDVNVTGYASETVDWTSKVNYTVES